MIYNLKKQSKEAKEKLDSYIENGVVIEIINLTKRSIKQNSYLHVLIQLYAIEHGNTLAEAKVYLKERCPIMIDDKGELRSTRDLNIQEMADFTEWMVTYCELHGMLVPSSKEWLENMDKFDKEIRKNQKWL